MPSDIIRHQRRKNAIFHFLDDSRESNILARGARWCNVHQRATSLPPLQWIPVASRSPGFCSGTAKATAGVTGASDGSGISGNEMVQTPRIEEEDGQDLKL